MNVLFAGLLSMVIAAGALEPALAADQGRPRPAPGRGVADDAPPAEGADLGPAEIQRIFDGYLLVQVQDALHLSNDQFAQMVPRLKALQDVRRRHQIERMRLLGELQRLSRPAPARTDNAALGERLKALRENEARVATELEKAYTAIDELLDLRQQARFRVFEEGIERKKLQLLLRARQNQGRPPPRQHDYK